MSLPPLNKQISTQAGLDQAWAEFFMETFRQHKYKGSDTTANRPTDGLNDGDYYMDTTLGKPIWYYSGGWVDATGGSV